MGNMTLYYHDIFKMRIDIEDTIKLPKNSLIIHSSIIQFEKSNYYYETEIRKILNLNILIPINDDSEIITYTYKTKRIDTEYAFEIEIPNNSLIVNCEGIIVNNSEVLMIINYLEPSTESPYKNDDDNCECESCHRAEQQKMKEAGM